MQSRFVRQCWICRYVVGNHRRIVLPLIDAHRPRDVLEILLAGILEVRLELAAHLPIGVVGDTDAAGLSDAFQPSRNVHPVAKDIAFLNHNIADMDADTELDALVGSHSTLRSAIPHCC